MSKHVRGRTRNGKSILQALNFNSLNPELELILLKYFDEKDIQIDVNHGKKSFSI